MSDQNINLTDNTIQKEIGILINNCLQKIDKTSDIGIFEEVINFINEKYEPVEDFDQIAYDLSLGLLEFGLSRFDNINTLLEIIFMLTIKIDHKFISKSYEDVTGGMVILAYIHLQIAEGRNGTWAYLPGTNNLLKRMKHVYYRGRLCTFPDNPIIKGDETDEDIIEYINEINIARERHRNFWIFYPRLTKCKNDEMDDLIINDADFIYRKLENIYKNNNNNYNINNNNNSNDDDDDAKLLETYIEELCSILYEYGSEIIKYKGEGSINKYFNILKISLTKPNISLEIKNTIAKALKSKINNFENSSFEKLTKSIWIEGFRNTVKRFE